MTGDGSLGGEIQRKTAEIDSWPAWAKPYESQTPSAPPAGIGIPTPESPRDCSGSAHPAPEHRR